MADVNVLLLGGKWHLGQALATETFGPISYVNGVDEPERYHRAVFYPPETGDIIPQAWYVYVTDAYLDSPSKLSVEQLHAALGKYNIAPHLEAVPKGNFKHERHVMN